MMSAKPVSISFRPVAALLLIWATALATPGCSDGTTTARQRTVRVTGKVTYKNQPVEGARVAFLGDGKSVPAFGLTAGDGTFALTTYDAGDGAAPGEHVVTVSKQVAQASAKTPPPNETMEQAATRAAETVADPKSLSLLPENYADPAKSGLQFTVTDKGPNDFQIELKD